MIDKHKAPGVGSRLGDLEPFFPEGHALGKRAELGMDYSEDVASLHSGQHPLAEALVAPRPVKGGCSLPQVGYRPRIVALSPVSHSEVVVCQRVQDDILAGC